MPGHGEKLGRKQETAIASLLLGNTIEAAAKAAGIHERTLRRWMSLPGFSHRYAEARNEVLDNAVSVLAKATRGAAVELIAIASDKTGSSTARVAAAKAILEYALRTRAATKDRGEGAADRDVASPAEIARQMTATIFGTAADAPGPPLSASPEPDP